MNGKKARALRKTSRTRKQYQANKRASMADNGQHPKFAVERKRTPKPAAQPTWPATKNQRAQSRPVTLIRPMRHIGFMAHKRKGQLRIAINGRPKWAVDSLVLSSRGANF